MSETLTAVDWNAWRAGYDSTSFAGQRRFYDRVFDEFPDQARFSVKALSALLARIDEPVSVVELGGWDGGFAAEMLRSHPHIREWFNYEISAKAVASSVCSDHRYYGVALEDWYWSHDHQADVFVASHVIEHLRLADVAKAVLATDCRFVYFQAPIGDAPSSWHNYRGSHILECGWTGVGDMMASFGFRMIEALSVPHVRCYEKADG